jgi:hypothetical protein
MFNFEVGHMLVRCLTCDYRFKVKIGYSYQMTNLSETMLYHELKCICGEETDLTVWFPPPDFNHEDIPYGQEKQTEEEPTTEAATGRESGQTHIAAEEATQEDRPEAS